ncbi:hypothetical protein RR48_06135 [Papilio machaon]|uniref:Uncharacterized protein n=1 Tax=Papilio machaon TaxID=76193 RepID=A0A194RW29_PAPMA|nr:hypothetical protein RR48_06135 [Papilio machaon]
MSPEVRRSGDETEPPSRVRGELRSCGCCAVRHGARGGTDPPENTLFYINCTRKWYEGMSFGNPIESWRWVDRDASLRELGRLRARPTDPVVASQKKRKTPLKYCSLYASTNN